MFLRHPFVVLYMWLKAGGGAACQRMRQEHIAYRGSASVQDLQLCNFNSADHSPNMAPAIRTSQSHGNDSMTDSRPSLETAELPAGEEKALPVPQPAPGPSADEPGALDKAVENVLHSDVCFVKTLFSH